MEINEFLMKHRVGRVEDDPKGYGDGLSDLWRCDCGEEFSYDGVEEYSGHLIELAKNVQP